LHENQSNTNSLGIDRSVSLGARLNQSSVSETLNESWFFYWKTSASLWKSKLERDHSGERVIIPINWSFHSDTGERFDFGEERPETDLMRLVEVVESLDKKVTFLLPVTPTPFISNGGIPHLLARVVSIDGGGRARAILNNDRNLIKIYSFYDSRVFQGYGKFIKQLSEYFLKKNISNDIVGCRYGTFSGERFYSFFEDYSSAYESAFRRFLEVKLRESENDIDELSYTQEFTESIQDIYVKTAKESLFENWNGLVDISILGASDLSFIERSVERDTVKKNIDDALISLSTKRLPSSVLLDDRQKNSVLGDLLKRFWKDSYLDYFFDTNNEEEIMGGSFLPLTFFNVCDQVFPGKTWEKLFLWDMIKANYSWCYQVSSPVGLNLLEEEVGDKIFFASGREIEDHSFHQMLRYFLAGGKVILNRSGLSVGLLRRLETFLLENNLDVKKVHFHTIIHNTVLGEGRLVVFDGDDLEKVTNDKKELFWNNLLSTFNIVHPKIVSDDEVVNYWMVRLPTTAELNYEGIRRVLFLNPTSYKKKVRISLPKSFALIKVSEEKNTQVRSRNSEIELEFLPGAIASLDFGVFHD